MRAIALGALARLGRLDTPSLLRALADPAPGVRRRACEEAARARVPGAPESDRVVEMVTRLLGDDDPSVVEAAAFALGELLGHESDTSDGSSDGGAGAGESWADASFAGAAVSALSASARNHDDPLCREAAVAALGAIEDPGGVAAILSALGDKPAVRRRAVLALAPFEGPDVEAALARARSDRDWQVRQAAEDLTGPT